MSAEDDARKAGQNMAELIKRKLGGAFALARVYSQSAVNDFFNRQLGGEFWENRTGQALARVFSFPFRSKDAIGFRMAHGVDYGVYLELANDRKHEAVRPVTFEWGKKFLVDARKILA